MDKVSDHQPVQDIDLRGIFLCFWEGKWWIVAAVLVGAFTSAALAYVVPETYEASVLVSPATSGGDGSAAGLGALTSRFGGLASIAGISVGTDTSKEEAAAYLRSEAIVEAYIREENLLPELYPQKWNSKSGAWDVRRKEDTPTIWKGARLFRSKILNVAKDAKTGLVTVKVRWRDAERAARWANGLVDLGNSHLRQRAIMDSERNIAYLNAEAPKTGVLEARQAIYAVMQTEINKAMLAKGSKEYAFKIIDPATVAEKPVSPDIPRWIGMGTAAGGLAAALLLLLRRNLTSGR